MNYKEQLITQINECLEVISYENIEATTHMQEMLNRNSNHPFYRELYDDTNRQVLLSQGKMVVHKYMSSIKTYDERTINWLELENDLRNLPRIIEKLRTEDDKTYENKIRNRGIELGIELFHNHCFNALWENEEARLDVGLPSMNAPIGEPNFKM